MEELNDLDESADLIQAAIPGKIPAPPPGLYPGVPGSEYATWDAVSFRRLGDFARSPYHCQQLLLHPEEQPESDAMKLGSLLHALVLEPEMVALKYGHLNLKPNTNPWKAMKQEMLSYGITPINTSMWDEARRMRDAVLKNPDSAAILELADAREVSGIAEWHDPDDPEKKLTYKVRLDALVARANMIVDLKTSADGSEWAMSRSVHNARYHVQATMYRNGVQSALYLPLPEDLEHLRKASLDNVVLITVESKFPYAVVCDAIDGAAMEVGEMIWNRLMKGYHACQESGVWPGYYQGIRGLSLPPFAFSDAALGMN